MRPASLVAGIGCNRNTAMEEMKALLEDVFETHNLAPASLKSLASIDVKSDENGLLSLAGNLNLPLGFYNRQELNQVKEIKNPSLNSETTVIGNNCIIRSGSVIYAGSTLGDDVRTGHNVLIREQVKIGSSSMIGTGVTIDGDSVIGSKVSIQTNAYIPLRTRIEDNVFLGPHCILTNDKYAMRTPYELQGPIIRRGASIGAGAVILPSIEVGAESVVGAGAVVTKDVAPKTIVYGVPAKEYATVPDNWKMPLE